ALKPELFLDAISRGTFMGRDHQEKQNRAGVVCRKFAGVFYCCYVIAVRVLQAILCRYTWPAINRVRRIKPLFYWPRLRFAAWPLLRCDNAEDSGSARFATDGCPPGASSGRSPSGSRPCPAQCCLKQSER